VCLPSPHFSADISTSVLSCLGREEGRLSCTTNSCEGEAKYTSGSALRALGTTRGGTDDSQHGQNLPPLSTRKYVSGQPVARVRLVQRSFHSAEKVLDNFVNYCVTTIMNRINRLRTGNPVQPEVVTKKKRKPGRPKLPKGNANELACVDS